MKRNRNKNSLIFFFFLSYSLKKLFNNISQTFLIELKVFSDNNNNDNNNNNSSNENENENDKKKKSATITQEQLDEMKENLIITSSEIEKAKMYEKKFRHDVMSHVHAFGDTCPKAKPIIHLGATSCFVGDNTDLIQIRDSLQLVRKKLLRTIQLLSEFTLKYSDLACLGFTHFQSAQLTTVGKRACLWLNDFVMDLEDLNYLIEQWGIFVNDDSVVRSNFYKYYHPKEVFIENSILNRSLENEIMKKKEKIQKESIISSEDEGKDDEFSFNNFFIFLFDSNPSIPPPPPPLPPSIK
jgi:hypothetical protein